MKFAKVNIDKSFLKQTLYIDKNTDIAITRVELNPDDSIDITFAVDNEVEAILGTPTSDLVNSQQIRRIKLG
jgi:hypothetical protein